MANNLILFYGCPNDSPLTPVESAMDKLLRLAAVSTLQVAGATVLFERMLVLTNDYSFKPPEGVELLFDNEISSSGTFDFGYSLSRVAQLLPAKDVVVYAGAGAAALFSANEWQSLINVLEEEPEVVTANNFFSADIIGWKPAEAINKLVARNELPDSDNNLAWSLCQRADLVWRQILPGNSRTFRTIFDIDTPTDGAALKIWLDNNSEAGLLKEFLSEEKAFPTRNAHAFLCELSHFESKVLVSGRVSGGVHRLLETRAHGQTRILSEERGMRASGREAKGLVKSLAGLLLEKVGPHRFFSQLAELSTAVAIDTRVLFAHLKYNFSRADRFNSDAFNPEGINDTYLREFTYAAVEVQQKTGLTVLLGGHSLIAGDLMLLLELTPPRFG